MKTIITIKGTHCASCKALIEDMCSESGGVQKCLVDFKTGKTEIEHDATFNFGNFREEVEKLGDYNIDDKNVEFSCAECGLRYKDKEFVEKCEAWCKEHKSCNLEIIKHAIQE